VWEISELGGTDFLYAVKLMPLEDLGLQSGAQSVHVVEPLNESSLHFLGVRRCLTIEWRRLKRKRRRSLFELTKKHYALYKHIRTRTDCLEIYGK
jgi:hypothetical protein